jgi:hypothetical protein
MSAWNCSFPFASSTFLYIGLTLLKFKECSFYRKIEKNIVSYLIAEEFQDLRKETMHVCNIPLKRKEKNLLKPVFANRKHVWKCFHFKNKKKVIAECLFSRKLLNCF